MSDDLPDVFRQVQPRRAPNELRQRVLAAVEPHLARRKKPRWERIVEWSVAASLALGIGLNVWLVQSDATWHARNSGPAGPPALIGSAGGVASATAVAAGKSVEQLVLSVWSAKPDPETEPLRHYRQMLEDLKTERRGRSL